MRPADLFSGKWHVSHVSKDSVGHCGPCVCARIAQIQVSKHSGVKDSLFVFSLHTLRCPGIQSGIRVWQCIFCDGINCPPVMLVCGHVVRLSGCPSVMLHCDCSAFMWSSCHIVRWSCLLPSCLVALWSCCPAVMCFCSRIVSLVFPFLSVLLLSSSLSPWLPVSYVLVSVIVISTPASICVRFQDGSDIAQL